MNYGIKQCVSSVALYLFIYTLYVCSLSIPYNEHGMEWYEVNVSRRRRRRCRCHTERLLLCLALGDNRRRWLFVCRSNDLVCLSNTIFTKPSQSTD